MVDERLAWLVVALVGFMMGLTTRLLTSLTAHLNYMRTKADLFSGQLAYLVMVANVVCVKYGVSLADGGSSNLWTADWFGPMTAKGKADKREV